MLTLVDIRGKQANKIRWETLKLLDWEKDIEVIEHIFLIKNPLFFSSRTPKQVISEVKETIRFKSFIKQEKLETK